MGVVPRVRSKLLRVLHVHCGKKLLQDLQNLDNNSMKRSMARFRGAREKGAMSFLWNACGGLAKRHDGEPPVEGDLWQEPGIA